MAVPTQTRKLPKFLGIALKADPHDQITDAIFFSASQNPAMVFTASVTP
jgi:hypothetical protein